MAREIRITVDDDEVFERMKRRKEALDLSWREVLKRGLRQDEGVSVDLGGLGRVDVGPGPESRPGPGAGAGAGTEPGEHEGHGPGPGPGFGERLSQRIQQQVQQSLETSLGVEDGFDDVADAEDAVLRFDGLDTDGAEVPLRVRLTTGGDGLDVEVVAVRRGRAVAGLNSFPPDARRRVAERLAGGETAVLSLAEGAEEYAVRPRLEWTTGDDGRPAVADVTVESVVFGAD